MMKNAVRPLVRRTRQAVSEAIWDYLMKPARGRTGRSPYDAAELKGLRTVLRSQNLCSVDGQQVRAFERAFAAAHDVPYAVASTSGTAAIHTALGALDLEPGAEVITAPITDLGTIIPIIQQNAIPVFADIDASYNMDPKDVARKVTPRTKAIVAVHLFGNPCDMTALRAIADANGLALIEDCSQAHFAEYRQQLVGTIGDLGCFSFQQSKLMTTGDGGMTITRNREYAERMKLFIDKGWARKGFGARAYLFHAPNYRMTELVGAVGIVQLSQAARRGLPPAGAGSVVERAHRPLRWDRAGSGDCGGRGVVLGLRGVHRRPQCDAARRAAPGSQGVGLRRLHRQADLPVQRIARVEEDIRCVAMAVQDSRT